jgi:hypothetical protein
MNPPGNLGEHQVRVSVARREKQRSEYLLMCLRTSCRAAEESLASWLNSVMSFGPLFLFRFILLRLLLPSRSTEQVLTLAQILIRSLRDWPAISKERRPR